MLASPRRTPSNLALAMRASSTALVFSSCPHLGSLPTAAFVQTDSPPTGSWEARETCLDLVEFPPAAQRAGQPISHGACPSAPPPAQSVPNPVPGQAIKFTVPLPNSPVFSPPLLAAAITRQVRPTWTARRSPRQSFQALPPRGPHPASGRKVERASNPARPSPAETLFGSSPERPSGPSRSFGGPSMLSKGRACPLRGLPQSGLRVDSSSTKPPWPGTLSPPSPPWPSALHPLGAKILQSRGQSRPRTGSGPRPGPTG